MEKINNDWYKLFDILDNIYCFLTKLKTPCTLKRINSTIKTIYKSHNNNNKNSIKFDINTIIKMNYIAPSFIYIEPAPFDPISNSIENSLDKDKGNDIKILNLFNNYDYISNLTISSLIFSYPKKLQAINKKKKRINEWKLRLKYFIETNSIEKLNELLYLDVNDENININNNNNNNNLGFIEEKKEHDNYFNSNEYDFTENIINLLKSQSFYIDQIQNIQTINGRNKKYENLHEDINLPIPIQISLENNNIEQFFSHQAKAINSLIIEKKHIVLSTETSSGKSLCFLLPILYELYKNPNETTAILLYPTKALAQDQLRSINNFINSSSFPFNINVMTCDGDSSYSERNNIIENANIILTNPDFLHMTLLSHHPKWNRILSYLKFIVLDESHIYNGIFGSHISSLMKRFIRILKHYSLLFPPQFISCSATINNPLEHFIKLVPIHIIGNKESIKVITESGAPRGKKTLILWRPNIQNAIINKLDNNNNNNNKNNNKYIDEILVNELNKNNIPIKRNTFQEYVHILCLLVYNNIRTLGFAKMRKCVEIIIKLAKKELINEYKIDYPENILKSYRGGYSKTYRRKIEKLLFSGNLIGCVSTNALELGIDIGDLDVTLHLGFPKSTNSLLQSIGRAGRKENSNSIAIIVLFENPIDKYYLKYPNLILKNPEKCIIDENNPYIIKNHIQCAAKELCLTINNNNNFKIINNVNINPSQSILSYSKYIKPGFDSILWNDEYISDIIYNLIYKDDILIQVIPSNEYFNEINLNNLLKNNYLYYTLDYIITNPWNNTKLRLIDDITFDVIDTSRNNLIVDHVEHSRAFYELYESAIYSIQSIDYLVTNLDLNEYKAYIMPTKVNYRTKALHNTDFKIINIKNHLENNYGVATGIVSIKKSVFGFKKLSNISNNIIDFIRFSKPLPNLEFQTKGIWIDIPKNIINDIKLNDNIIDIYQGIHGCNHLLQSLIPTFILCDVNDIDITHPLESSKSVRTRKVILFDRTPGGVGICESIFPIIDLLINRAYDVINNCKCNDGCVECVYSTDCHEVHRHISKEATKLLLKSIIDNYFIDNNNNNNIIINDIKNKNNININNKRKNIIQITPKKKKRIKKIRENINHNDTKNYYNIGNNSWNELK